MSLSALCKDHNKISGGVYACHKKSTYAKDCTVIGVNYTLQEK